MTKLNEIQIQVLKAVEFQGNVSDVTVHPSTLKALKSRGLIAEDGTITTGGREAIGVKDVNPHAAIEAEVEEEYTDHPMVTESVENPWVPFLNRTARREIRRNIARFNRSVMRLRGKRIRKYGPDSPEYFNRLYFGSNAA